MLKGNPLPAKTPGRREGGMREGNEEEKQDCPKLEVYNSASAILLAFALRF